MKKNKIIMIDRPSVDRPIGWTTLEESKELRKLGLGEGTNDLWYCKSYLPDYSLQKQKITSLDIPAWSLGALITILPPWVVVYDKEGIGHDAFFKIMNGSAWYEYFDGEKYVQTWKIVESLTIIAVIGMVKFMISHPDILETKTAYL